MQILLKGDIFWTPNNRHKICKNLWFRLFCTDCSDQL